MRRRGSGHRGSSPRPRWRHRRRRSTTLGSIVLVAVIASPMAIRPNGDDVQAAATARVDRPNVVLIVTDDQRWDTLSVMPNVRRLIGAHGTTFRNAFVVNPVCCPSRATILTGAYSHTTGVYTNEASHPNGGFHAFDDEPTIATKLQNAGYATAFIGKYLNGYGSTYVSPGWDTWFANYGGATTTTSRTSTARSSVTGPIPRTTPRA